jgi:hypothetical protein
MDQSCTRGKRLTPLILLEHFLQQAIAHSARCADRRVPAASMRLQS